MDVGGLGGREDVGLGRVRVRVPEVVHDRGVEEHRVLRHDADVLPDAVELQVADVAAVHQDRPAVHVVEPVQQLQARRFPAARLPHECGLRPRRHREADPVDGRLLALVGEPHVPELDLAFGGIEGGRVRLFDDAGSFFELRKVSVHHVQYSNFA